MLDGAARKLIDPALEAIADWLAARGATANGLTWAGVVFAMLACAALAFQATWLALFFILASRACDGLDGTVARAHAKRSGAPAGTDYGGFLDISLDFAFYGLVPLGFALADPGANAVAACVLLLSFYVNGGTFLAFSVMAEKGRMRTDARETNRGTKSLYFTTGLAEGTETIAVFVLMCLWPAGFVWIAYAFAALCFVTALARIALARKSFS